MKAFTIGVMGNCQAHALGLAVAALCPQAEVWQLNWAQAKGNTDTVARMASRADYVITQININPADGPLTTEQLRTHVKQLSIVPKIYFPGYQPDAVELPKGPGIKSPMGGVFHSALAVAAYLRGISAAETTSLFNAYIYAQLGYFDEFDKSYALQIASAKNEGGDISRLLEMWTSDIFMHMPNRPKIHVAMDLARSALGELGLETETNPQTPRDPLEGRSWPVYPEIARRLGVEGSLTFRRKYSAAIPTVELDEFVAQSHLSYAMVDPKFLKQERVLHAMDVLEREGL